MKVFGMDLNSTNNYINPLLLQSDYANTWNQGGVDTKSQLPNLFNANESDSFNNINSVDLSKPYPGLETEYAELLKLYDDWRTAINTYIIVEERYNNKKEAYESAKSKYKSAKELYENYLSMQYMVNNQTLKEAKEDYEEKLNIHNTCTREFESAKSSKEQAETKLNTAKTNYENAVSSYQAQCKAKEQAALELEAYEQSKAETLADLGKLTPSGTLDNYKKIEAVQQSDGRYKYESKSGIVLYTSSPHALLIENKETNHVIVSATNDGEIDCTKNNGCNLAVYKARLDKITTPENSNDKIYILKSEITGKNANYAINSIGGKDNIVIEDSKVGVVNTGRIETPENGVNVVNTEGANIQVLNNSEVNGIITGYTKDTINVSDSTVSGDIWTLAGDDNITITNSNTQNIYFGNNNNNLFIENSTTGGIQLYKTGEGDYQDLDEMYQNHLNYYTGVNHKNNITIKNCNSIAWITTGVANCWHKGDDTLNIENSNVGNIDVGEGEDNLLLKGGSLWDIDTGEGNDSVSVLDTSINKLLTSKGNDLVEGERTTIKKLRTGSGDDEGSFKEVTGGKFKFGLGNDLVFIDESNIDEVNTGLGDDCGTVKDSNIGEYNTGSGNDKTVLENSHVDNFTSGMMGNDAIANYNSTIVNNDFGKNDVVVENGNYFQDITKEKLTTINIDSQITVGETTMSYSEFANYMFNQPVKFETEQEYQKYMLGGIIQNLEGMKQVFKYQETQDGVCASMYNALKESADLGISDEDVIDFIQKQEEMVNALTAAYLGQSDMTFEQAFEHYTGATYSQEKINKYMEVSNIYSVIQQGLASDPNGFPIKFEEATGKSIEEVEQEFALCAYDTFGKSDALTNLVSKYQIDQEQFADKLSAIMSTTGIVCMVVGGVLCLTGVGAGAGGVLMVAGNKLAIAGIFTDNFIDLADDSTDADGLTGEELGTFAKETVIDGAIYMVNRFIGYKSGKAGTNATAIGMAKGWSPIASKLFGTGKEVIIDASLSLTTDYIVENINSFITDGEFILPQEYFTSDRLWNEAKCQLTGLMSGAGAARLETNGLTTTVTKAQDLILKGDFDGAKAVLYDGGCEGIAKNDNKFDSFVKSTYTNEAAKYILNGCEANAKQYLSDRGLSGLADSEHFDSFAAAVKEGAAEQTKPVTEADPTKPAETEVPKQTEPEVSKPVAETTTETPKAVEAETETQKPIDTEATKPVAETTTETPKTVEIEVADDIKPILSDMDTAQKPVDTEIPVFSEDFSTALKNGDLNGAKSTYKKDNGVTLTDEEFMNIISSSVDQYRSKLKDLGCTDDDINNSQIVHNLDTKKLDFAEQLIKGGIDPQGALSLIAGDNPFIKNQEQVNNIIKYINMGVSDDTAINASNLSADKVSVAESLINAGIDPEVAFEAVIKNTISADKVNNAIEYKNLGLNDNFAVKATNMNEKQINIAKTLIDGGINSDLAIQYTENNYLTSFEQANKAIDYKNKGMREDFAVFSSTMEQQKVALLDSLINANINPNTAFGAVAYGNSKIKTSEQVNKTIEYKNMGISDDIAITASVYDVKPTDVDTITKFSKLFSDGVLSSTDAQYFNYFLNYKQGTISSEVTADINKLYDAHINGINSTDAFVPKIKNATDDAISTLKPGDICTVEGTNKVSIKNADGTLKQLDITPQEYMDLFPPVSKYMNPVYGEHQCEVIAQQLNAALDKKEYLDASYIKKNSISPSHVYTIQSFLDTYPINDLDHVFFNVQKDERQTTIKIWGYTHSKGTVELYVDHNKQVISEMSDGQKRTVIKNKFESETIENKKTYYDEETDTDITITTTKNSDGTEYSERTESYTNGETRSISKDGKSSFITVQDKNTGNLKHQIEMYTDEQTGDFIIIHTKLSEDLTGVYERTLYNVSDYPDEYDIITAIENNSITGGTPLSYVKNNPDGTKTYIENINDSKINRNFTQGVNGIDYDYKYTIKDDSGNTILDVDKSFVKDSDTQTTTKINGKKYVATFDNSNYKVTIQNPNGTIQTLDIAKIAPHDADKCFETAKKLPADSLIYLSKLKTWEYIDDNIKASMGSENRVLNAKDDPNIIAHELGHFQDYLLGIRNNTELKTIYEQELAIFNSTHTSIAGINKTQYFLANSGSNGSGLAEIIAETNMLLSSCGHSNVNVQERAQLLVENFPNTIAKIASLLGVNNIQ